VHLCTRAPVHPCTRAPAHPRTRAPVHPCTRAPESERFAPVSRSNILTMRVPCLVAALVLTSAFAVSAQTPPPQQQTQQQGQGRGGRQGQQGQGQQGQGQQGQGQLGRGANPRNPARDNTNQTPEATGTGTYCAPSTSVFGDSATCGASDSNRGLRK